MSQDDESLSSDTDSMDSGGSPRARSDSDTSTGRSESIRGAQGGMQRDTQGGKRGGPSSDDDDSSRA